MRVFLHAEKPRLKNFVESLRNKGQSREKTLCNLKTTFQERKSVLFKKKWSIIEWNEIEKAQVAFRLKPKKDGITQTEIHCFQFDFMTRI